MISASDLKNISNSLQRLEQDLIRAAKRGESEYIYSIHNQNYNLVLENRSILTGLGYHIEKTQKSPGPGSRGYLYTDAVAISWS